MTFLGRLLFAPAYGLAMGLAIAAVWLLMGRALTTTALWAILTVMAATTVSALVAVSVDQLQARRRWTARFAAALFILFTGTVLVTAGLLGAERAWATHDMMELSPKLVLVVLTYTSVGTLYSVLTILGFLMIPIGLPVLIAAAALIARQQPAADQRAGATSPLTETA